MRYKIKSLLWVVFLIVSIKNTFAQIPVEKYKGEIKALKNAVDFKEYWGKLFEIDQNVLVKTENDQIRDSISIDNMIKTALMVEIHGNQAITPNTSVHILNLSHNYFGSSNLAYWSIIKISKEIGNPMTEQFYPSYVLESIGLTFYGYSFLNKEDMYKRALEKLNNFDKDKNIIEELIKAFDKQKHYKALKNKEIVGEWYQKPFKDIEEEDTFQFILKEDNNLYFKKFSSLNKLIPKKENEFYRIYSVENEPFGWTFKLENSGKLSLLDHDNEILIKYRRSDDN